MSSPLLIFALKNIVIIRYIVITSALYSQAWQPKLGLSHRMFIVKPEKNLKRGYNKMRGIVEGVSQGQAAYENATHLGIRNGLNKFERTKKRNKEEWKREE